MTLLKQVNTDTSQDSQGFQCLQLVVVTSAHQSTSGGCSVRLIAVEIYSVSGRQSGESKNSAHIE
jgi:hypothetical protein